MSKQNDLGPWCLESDGSIYARTHYAVRDNPAFPCGVERIDFESRFAAEVALGLRDPPARRRLGRGEETQASRHEFASRRNKE